MRTDPDHVRKGVATALLECMPRLRVSRKLNGVIKRRAKPKTIVSDSGTEFASTALLKWSEDTKVEWRYIARPCGARLRHDASHSTMHSLRVVGGRFVMSA